MQDHLHALLSLPAILTISKAVQLIKGGSSKWLGDNGLKFAWQEGYAAFSVSSSQMRHTVNYINLQEKHHVKRDFAQELRLLLRSTELLMTTSFFWASISVVPTGLRILTGVPRH